MAGGRHRPPPPAASSGAALDRSASVPGLTIDNAWDDFMQQLHPLESFREAVWSQCGESWSRIAAVFDPASRGVVTSSAFVAGVEQLRIPVSSLSGCSDAAELFDSFLDPTGVGEVPLWCLAKQHVSVGTCSDTGSGSSFLRGALHRSPSSFSDRAKLRRSPSTASSSSFSRARSPRAEFRWVEHRIATVNTDIDVLTKQLDKLTTQQRSQPSKHAAETARALSLTRSRSEQAISKHRVRLEALQEEAAQALASKAKLGKSAKLAHQRIQAACKLKLSTEALIDATERQIPAILSAHAAGVLAEREAASAEQMASESYCELYDTVGSSKDCVQALMEERDMLQVQSSEHAQRAQAMVETREEARQCLIDEDICLRSEITEERERFGVAICRMEGMMDHLESSVGPQGQIAEAAMVHFEETNLREEWEAEEAFAKENFESVIKRGKSSIAALKQRLKEQQQVATRRGQDAMDSGVSAVSAAEAEGTESIRRSEALSARVDREGRRLRSDLNKTARFLGGHQAQNVRLEEVAAASQREFDSLTRQSSEIQEDIAEMRERREVMISELQVEQQRTAGIRLSHEERASSDWRELAELRAESKALTGNLLDERETLSRITARWQAIQNYWQVLDKTHEQAKLSSESFALAESTLEQKFVAELSEREMQARVKREELLEEFGKARPVERPAEESVEAGAIEEDFPPWFGKAMQHMSG